MKSDGNNFNYFSKNQLTKLVHLMQFKRMLTSYLGWEEGGLSHATDSFCDPSLGSREQSFRRSIDKCRVALSGFFV